MRPTLPRAHTSNCEATTEVQLDAPFAWIVPGVRKVIRSPTLIAVCADMKTFTVTSSVKRHWGRAESVPCRASIVAACHKVPVETSLFGLCLHRSQFAPDGNLDGSGCGGRRMSLLLRVRPISIRIRQIGHIEKLGAIHQAM